MLYFDWFVVFLSKTWWLLNKYCMICQLYFFFTKWKSPYYIECVCQVVRKIFILLNNYLCISLNMNHILFWPGGQCVYCRGFFFTKADSVIKELKVKNISLVRAIGNQYNEYYCHMPLKNSLNHWEKISVTIGSFIFW